MYIISLLKIVVKTFITIVVIGAVVALVEMGLELYVQNRIVHLLTLSAKEIG